MKFKVGDKVKVVDAMDECDIGKVGIISEVEDVNTFWYSEKRYKLYNQDECQDSFFYEYELQSVHEDEVQEVKTIGEEEYKKALDNLIKENKELQCQLEYADKQLERQANIIDKLEDYAHELHDNLIEKIKEE